ncbi:mucin-like protein isoform X2 [Actinia tenebrosa]|nr:mucin-like protein isoform X2 [Actinia tenebrosa]
MISFIHPWYRRWPSNFAHRFWFEEEAILAPYWALIDRVYSFRSGVSKVFYHLYKDSDKDPAAQNILRRAVEDVNKHTQNNMLPKEFTNATLVLVVTWVNIRHWYSGWRSELRDKYNTFQAVLITDNVFSFVMYNYPKNGIQWSVPAEREDYNRYWKSKGLPVVGFNAGHGNDIYYNHPRSGCVMAVDIDQIEGLNIFKSPDSHTIKSTRNGIRGRVFIRLEDSRGEEDHRLRCVKWYYQQGDHRAFTQSLQPCPCSEWQARRDRRFRLTTWSWPRICYYSRFPTSWGWGQECCYKFERAQGRWGWWWWISFLAYGFPDGGNAHRFHKYRYPTEYQNDDKQAYQDCCIKSSMCWMYQEVRPSDTCSRYVPPRWSWFWGDPHFVTMDRKNYTFNGLGEYVMLDAKDGYFQLQARTSLAKGNGTATVFTGAVAQENNSVPVQVTLPYENETMEVLVDGKPFDFKSLTSDSYDLNNGSITVSKPQKQCLEMTFPSGMSVTICEKQNILSIVTAAPESFKNKTKGLLGTWNGNPEDDFTLPNGTVLPHDMNGTDIHYKYGMAWQVTNETSLFTYKEGESSDTFLNKTFRPMFIEELKFYNDSLKVEAEAKCQGDVNCLFDAASTEDVEIGLNTKQLRSQLVYDSKKMSNEPPKISKNSSVIELTVNTTANVTVEVTDANNDSITLNVTGLPADGRVRHSNSSYWTITWHVTTKKLDLQFIASDGESVSALIPKIYLCACHHGGHCEKPSKITGADSGEEKFIENACNCVDGYTGKYCETDIDACEANLNPCYPGVDCIDLPPPANVTDGYKCASCPAGYSGHGASCTDIDECDHNNGDCEQLCLNKPGSYECSCKIGYQLNADKKTCQDIDECVLASDCMHKCTNIPGSYNCSCYDNFKVKPGDSKLCVPENPCNEGEHECKQVCYKLSDSQQKCSCYKGYELKDDQKTCQDVNECATKNGCNQRCNNTIGGYYCSCLQGFELSSSSDNKTCVDINECMEWTFNCSDPSLKCMNTDGSYKCECEEGLYWNVTLKKCIGLKKGQDPPPPPPAPKPKKPNQNETMNAVNITIKNFNASKWNKPKEEKFKKTMAKAITSYCNEKGNDCSSEVKGARRFTRLITWTQDDIHLMPGFPIQINLKKYLASSLVARIAFYINFPRAVMLQTGSTVNSELVLNILNAFEEDIERALNASIIDFSIYKEKSREGENLNRDKDMLHFIVGAAVGGTVFILLIIVLAVICNKRCKRKLFPAEDYQMKEAS